MSKSDASERYYIRDGYVTNSATERVPEKDYWNERRVETSTLFQYHVYRKAGRWLGRHRRAHVLDIGCGTARKAAELLIPACDSYIGIDQASAIEYCRRTVSASNAKFIVDDLESPASQFTRSFDLIICADVIEHLVVPDKLLAFARDCLATKGQFIVSTPERDVMHGAGATRPTNPEHIREWNRGEFRQLLESSGFSVKRLNLAPQFRIKLSRSSWKLLRGQLHRPVGYWGCQVATCVRK